jgi:UDP-glucose 4-epimerase
MTRVLVTGGAGYIGGTAVALLLDGGYEVAILDDCSTGHEDAVDSRAKFIKGSVLDKDAIREAMAGCDAVMHFAAKSLVGESVEKPDLYMHVNFDGSTNLVDVMKELGVKKIVFSSTAATYGEPREVPITETSITDPTNPYGASKLKVDHLLTARAASDGIAAISLRYFNVAGALQTANGWLAERHNPETHLIPNVLRADQSTPLKIFGTDWPTPDHTCVRDYIHVVDLIDAHIRALTALVAGQHEIINLGSGDGYSVRQVIDTASKVIGTTIPAIEVDRRAGDPAVLIASVEKAKSFLNWIPTRNMEAMINDAYQSLR